MTATFQRQLFDRTKASGAEVIRRKGGAGWAVVSANYLVNFFERGRNVG